MTGQRLRRGDDPAGPTARELASIEREWPAIAADLAEVDAAITAALTGAPVTIGDVGQGIAAAAVVLVDRRVQVVRDVVHVIPA